MSEKNENICKANKIPNMCEYGETLTAQEIDCKLSSMEIEMWRRKMDKNLLSKASCSLKEKNGMIKVIGEIIALSEIVRRYGTMALEEVVQKLSGDFIKIGIRLILEGIDPATIEETMLKTVYTENFKGTELLKRLITIVGVLAIQEGENSYVIKTKLFSMLGEKTLSQLLENSSEIDIKLENCNPFKSGGKEIENIIKGTIESKTFNFIKSAFSKTLKSSMVLKNLTSIFIFKDNKKALSNNIKAWSGAISDFISEIVEPRVSCHRMKNLRMSQLMELAALVQSSYLHGGDVIVGVVGEVLQSNETVNTKYRSMKIGEYEAEIRGRVREFFKIILALITKKKNFLQLDYSLLCDILHHTMVEGKAAVKFIKDTEILIAFGKLEKEVFALSELKEYAKY